MRKQHIIATRDNASFQRNMRSMNLTASPNLDDTYHRTSV
jgi:hypothetical protein